MSIYPIIYTFDMLLWLIIAVNVAYILCFAVTTALPAKNHHFTTSKQQHSFLILIPAYHEDAVIAHTVETIIHQDYPQELFHVAVISDHMSAETNQLLAKLPITLLQPSFQKSSKAKALQFAMNKVEGLYDFVVVLDADNIVASDYISQLNAIAQPSMVIQCHRTAKNADNDVAVLDGISEEINNTIFRKGHNRMGLSSALIGSGMCFDYQWFKNNVNELKSAVEDRELEALLMKQHIYIHYAEDIYVLDEKVSSSDNFQRQRQRWMSGQVQSFFQMVPYLPKAIIDGNINYIDKTFQQVLVPRSILLVIIPILCVIAPLTSYILHHTSYIYSLKWWILLFCLCIALFMAIPKQMRKQSLFRKLLSFPSLVWKMVLNLQKIDRKNTDFIHTKHGE